MASAFKTLSGAGMISTRPYKHKVDNNRHNHVQRFGNRGMFGRENPIQTSEIFPETWVRSGTSSSSVATFRAWFTLKATDSEGRKRGNKEKPTYLLIGSLWALHQRRRNGSNYKTAEKPYEDHMFVSRVPSSAGAGLAIGVVLANEKT